VRDLGRAVTEAAATLVAGTHGAVIPILACHMHLMRDIGKDLMRSMHDELRGRFRHFKVLPQLRALARGLGRGLAPELAEARQGVERWLRQADTGHRRPPGTQGLAIVRALAQWVLDFPRDGLDQGFPFDVPMLDLYGRCIEVLAALDAFLRTSPSDPKVLSAAEPDADSRSLPTPDRDLVRADAMFLRIHAAANSRAPRRSSGLTRATRRSRNRRLTP
jgi:hypothetical protein